MANPNKRKGTAFESSVSRFVAAAIPGSVRVFRPPPMGRFDVGDVHIGGAVVLQCKDYGTWGKSLVSKWLSDVEVQAGHAGAPLGVVVIKQRREAGVSSGAASDSVVVMSAGTFAEFLGVYFDGAPTVPE